MEFLKLNQLLKEKKNLEIWLDSENKMHGSMEWIEDRKKERGIFTNIFKDAKSIISVALNYYTGDYKKKFKSDFKFSNYAWGDDYHLVLKNKLFSLLKWIKDN